MSRDLAQPEFQIWLVQVQNWKGMLGEISFRLVLRLWPTKSGNIRFFIFITHDIR